jgi:hypothetical protein
VFFFGFDLGLVDYILANAVARVFSYFGVGSPGGV